MIGSRRLFSNIDYTADPLHLAFDEIRPGGFS